MKTRLAFAIVGLTAIGASIAVAQTSKDKTKSATPAAAGTATADLAQQLPPGWTEADMKACTEAGTPGKMHEHLMQAVGAWQGKCTSWMAPDTEAVKSECTFTVSSMMDGRFTKAEMAGDMPGMGPFNGFGMYGYDNVAQKFQASWVSNCGTGMMNGTGDLSSDGKTLTWTYQAHCPITRKLTAVTEIERITGKDSRTLEVRGSDPKSGKEYKMMFVEFTRKGGATAAAETR